MKQEIKALKKWLETHKASELAFKLGYDHSTAITNWVNNENIPSYQLDRVLEIINETPSNNPKGKTKTSVSGVSVRT